MHDRIPAPRPRTAVDLTRRGWLRGLALCAGVFVLGGGGRLGKAAAPLAIEAPGNAVGAVAATIGGDRVKIRIDPALGPTEIRIAGKSVDVGHRILLKGKGPARGRFLEDARNAPKLGANIRDALSKLDPPGAATYAANHKAWSRPFAQKVLQWSKRLARSPVKGRRIADTYGRAALLEWAGAKVDENAPEKSPASLAKLPLEPGRPTASAYENHIEALVAALS
jgi:hypothetical protein